MQKAHLFLGFPLDSSTNTYFEGLDSAFKQLYSLQDICFRNQRYVGKIVEQIETLSQLELLQDNIYSLLKKFMPQYPFHEQPLHLFPILKTIHE